MSFDQVTSTAISIHCPATESGPEFRFAVEYLLKYRLGLNLMVVEEIANQSIYEIKQNETLLATIPCSRFFSGIGDYVYEGKAPPVDGHGADTVLFRNADIKSEDTFHFDLFAAVFYLITRIEELGADKDEHGRFSALSSLLYSKDALRFPIIDLWVGRLRSELSKRGVTVAHNSFEWWNTIDIDQPYAIIRKPFVRQCGIVLRKALRGKFRDVLQLLIGIAKRRDPFDVVDNMHFEGARNILFILSGGESRFDLAKGRRLSVLEKYVKDHSHQFEFGIHPSYMTSVRSELIRDEKARLEKWTQKNVDQSRQHYLRFEWPNTMLRLIENDIKFDFTMGFADGMGFRAGTSRPFPFYDLKKRQVTQLTIVPFSVMDVTLKNYLKLSAQQAITELSMLIEILKSCDGLFVSLWHNSSMGEIDGWSGWRKVYYEMKNMAIE